MGPYGYEYYDYMEPVTEMFAGFFAVLVLVIALVALAVCITMYVLNALGMYTIAKRRGIHHSWLAWVPIGEAWLLGSISDQYQFLTKGRSTKRRTKLLVLNIVLCGASVLSSVAEILTTSASALDNGAVVGAVLGLVFLLGIVLVVLSIVNMVYAYIALYDLYASCDPSGATVCLVFSILFSVTQPFFVFFNRKKDLGMPPRKSADPQPVVESCAEAFDPSASVPVGYARNPYEDDDDLPTRDPRSFEEKAAEVAETPEIPAAPEENKDAD